MSDVRRFQVHIGLLPMLAGLLAGLGLLVVLQQAGSIYPTVGVTIGFLVGGLLVGILLPTLAHALRPPKPSAP
jgi:hypothetical protein